MRRQGFTLIELLVVISIAFIVLVVVIPNLIMSHKVQRERERQTIPHVEPQAESTYKNG